MGGEVCKANEVVMVRGMHAGLKYACVAFTFSLLEGGGRDTAPLALPDLSAYRWKNRILMVDTPAADTPAYLSLRAAFAPVQSELRERNLILLTQLSAPAFRVRLVGKDGGVKYDSLSQVTPAEIFARIDEMPIRRAEISRPSLK